jgi:hypothetical protein
MERLCIAKIPVRQLTVHELFVIQFERSASRVEATADCNVNVAELEAWLKTSGRGAERCGDEAKGEEQDWRSAII